jgi:hypothetical protein
LAANRAVLSPIGAGSWRSEILPRRLYRRGGASVVRRDAALNRMEDLDVKVCEEANDCVTVIGCTVRDRRKGRGERRF